MVLQKNKIYICINIFKEILRNWLMRLRCLDELKILLLEGWQTGDSGKVVI